MINHTQIIINRMGCFTWIANKINVLFVTDSVLGKVNAEKPVLYKIKTGYGETL